MKIGTSFSQVDAIHLCCFGGEYSVNSVGFVRKNFRCMMKPTKNRTGLGKRFFQILRHLVQDPGTKAARRVWTSINVGTEIYVSPAGVTAEWTVSDFDVLVPTNGRTEYM